MCRVGILSSNNARRSFTRARRGVGRKDRRWCGLCPRCLASTTTARAQEQRTGWLIYREPAAIVGAKMSGKKYKKKLKNTKKKYLITSYKIARPTTSVRRFIPVFRHKLIIYSYIYILLHCRILFYFLFFHTATYVFKLNNRYMFFF